MLETRSTVALHRQNQYGRVNMMKCRTVSAFVCVFVTVLGCVSSAPSTKTPTVEIPAPLAEPATLPAIKEPTVAHSPATLRLVDQEPFGIEFDGHMLALGISRTDCESVLGPPLRAKDNPVDGSVMGGTTTLFYEDPGMSVRTKDGVVEGFYVYISGAELDGMVLKPARPKLPHNVPLDATPERIVELVGEPDERDTFALLNWFDLHYFRGNALIEYHFDKGTFDSVKVEYASLTKRKRSGK